MATRTLGVIIDGATGRLGTTQHLRSLLAIRAEGGLRLGNGDVLMLRNHGPLVVGKSVKECFSRMYYLERACRMQVATLSQCRDAATELVWPDERDCATMAKAFENGDAVIAREWNALVRMLSEIAPGFDR